MDLPDHWHIIAETRELKPHRPNALRRHGREWVVWKTSTGQWTMQQDRCPHRSARLSQGKVTNDCVVCPFHGFQFNSAGTCSLVPETGKPAPGLKLETYALHEAHGFLWWKKGGVSTQTPPWFSELTGVSWGSHDVQQWHQNISRCIENQLDYAHLPFVHRYTIGRGFDVRKPVKFGFNDDGVSFIMSEATHSGVVVETSGIRFLYPGIWRLKISPKMQAFIAFVAVDENTTRIYLRSYQSLVTWWGLRNIFGWILKLSNRKILREDRAVVLGQHPRDVRELGGAVHETLFPSDQAIWHFRKWLAKSSVQ